MNNLFKGAKMPLPFIAGLAVGAGIVVAYNKRDVIKEKLANSLEKSKNIADEVKEFSQNGANELKEFSKKAAKNVKKFVKDSAEFVASKPKKRVKKAVTQKAPKQGSANV